MSAHPNLEMIQFDAANLAIFHAKAIVDVLMESDQVDENSSVPAVLSAVFEYLCDAEKALNPPMSEPGTASA